MPIWRRKGVKKTPGAYGESIPRYPKREDEKPDKPDLNDLDELQRMYPHSVRVRCFRCGEEFLIGKSPESYIAECNKRYGINVILDGLCGDLVKRDRDEKNALRERMRRI